ncbi:MAG: hypothetical protein MUC77_13860 [Chromatiaceae bacterium]|nr:hypothetical protein [Chromatiaceae bacterium]
MDRIIQSLNDIAKLPAAFDELRHHLKYHTESGFSVEEANGYAQQMDDIEAILIPAWKAKLRNTTYEVFVDSQPTLGGFLKVRVAREGSAPIEVFAESYTHFNSEMCDGSCYQYVYQKVLCYRDGLSSGRVAL